MQNEKIIEKTDVWSKLNILSTYIAASITVYFVISDCAKQISIKDTQKDITLNSIFIVISTILGYGNAYLSKVVNIKNQKMSDCALDSLIKLDFQDYFNKENNKEPNVLNNHDKFVLACVFLVNVCYGVFPSLFMFSIFTKPNELKPLKAGIICASALFGGLCAVAHIRNTKKLLLNND